jgi:hypothetical protein
MSTDPVADADSHLVKMAQENEAFALAEKRVSDEIMELFTKTVRQVNYKHLAAPYVSALGPTRLKYQTLSESVRDTCDYGAPLYALMAVMAGSDCPLVAAWRVAMAENYIKHHAADIAGVQE